MTALRAVSSPAQETLRPATHDRQQVSVALAQFTPITLAEMESVQLLDRVDTKYLLPVSHLIPILEGISAHYRLLHTEGPPASLYHTRYFDTPDFALYHDHHNDRHERYKVRARTYVDSDISFLEIKRKTKRGRTQKVRCQIPEAPLELEGDNLTYVQTNYPGNAWRLRPVISNTFRRITIVNEALYERLTIDLDFRFDWNGRGDQMNDLAIVEVKQPRFSLHSPFIKHMQYRAIYRTGFSKYCAGMAYIYPHLKANRFKRRSLLIRRLRRMENLP
ncbi:MAG: polyphosphate polymerase domain-containing protein [Caldilineaceae bacterium]|nr:polyphosphate polymerase domain-containing protein [Caldilineaceae bacterium]